MKIEILQEELMRGVMIVLRAAPVRAQLPILSSLRVEAKNNEIVLEATDLEIGIRHKVSCRVIEKGSVAIMAKTLSELLGTLRPGKLEIELKENVLVVKGEGFRGKIATMEVNEFPRLTDFDKGTLSVSAKEFMEKVERVSFASARDGLRPVLTGVLLESGDGLRLVATDGFRLALTSLKSEGEIDKKNKQLLVPARALYEVSRIMKEGKIELAYLDEAKQVLFRSEETLLITQLIEGNFPDYNKILPTDFDVELLVSREELLAAVKTAAVFARENSNMMKWVVENGKIIVSANSGEGGSGEVEVPAKVEGGGVEVIFNTKYVLDYLNLVGGENVWIGLGGKLSPGMMAESESEKESAFYVVMPINA